MGRRRCCCFHPGCDIFDDDFDRPNSTSLGSNWLEDLGDPEIFGNTLRMPPDSRAICTVPHPLWDATGHVKVDMIDIQEGDIFRLIIDFIDDEDDPLYRNYLFAEYEAGAGGEGLLKVGSAVAGVASYAHVLPGDHDPSDYLLICRGVSGIYAQTSHAALAWYCPGEYDKKPYKVGLENPGSENTIRFDNLDCWDHEHTDPACGGCECDCDGHCVGKALTATFDATGDCDCIDGESVPLEWDEDRPGDWVWNGQDTLPEWRCESGNATYEFDLYCASTPDKWMLVQKQGLSDCNGGWTFGGVFYYAYPSSYTCDPFCLTFGPFSCDWSCEPDGCECSYYIVVTP